MGQLPLALRLAAHARLETFIERGNEIALGELRALGAGGIWLWGAPGVGKSHLLQAICAAAHEQGLRSMYVPLAENRAREVDPDLLVGLEALDVLALDDVQAIAGERAWELALFRLFEALGAGHMRLLVASRAAPQATGFALPDLTSRAAGQLLYRIAPLDDEGRELALERHAAHRGLELDRAAVRYLMSHVARDMTALCDCLDCLDRESMAAQRRLTVPFIRETLARHAR